MDRIRFKKNSKGVSLIEVMIALTILSTLSLSSPSTSANDSTIDDVKINIPITCNLSSTVNTAHTANVVAGSYTAGIGKSTLTAACNDSEGFAIYAIGYSNDTHGNTDLIGLTDSTHIIPTDAVTTGFTSGWSMKLTPLEGTYTPTIENNFNAYSTIPTNYTKVAYKNSTTDTVAGSSLETTYAVYVKPTQPGDTYKGQVKYTLVHPSTHNPPVSRPATLDTGQIVNHKMKSLSATVVNGTETNVTYDVEDSLIKSIQISNALPNDFAPSSDNTISLEGSEHPVYIFFDNTNDTGVMNIYTEGDIVINPDSSYLFSNMSSLSTAPILSSLDTSSAINIERMFASAGYNATNFSLDLSSWDTSSVTNMSDMFASAGYNATTWSISGLSDWDTSSVTTMSDAFRFAGYSNSTFNLDLSNWDTSSVTTMSYMFYQAGHSATTWSVGDLSNWNTSSLKSLSHTFCRAGYSATTWSIGNISDWDTSNVTNMYYTFSNAGRSASVFNLDLSSWDTSSVTNMGYMFWEAGYSATTWTVTIPQTNGNRINNREGAMYGNTSSIYATPHTGRHFTLVQ